LTGDPPFTGSTAQAIVAKVLTEQPRSLITQRHTIAPNVEQAVLTALDKLPADRFATAGEFAAALANRTYTGTTVTAHAQRATVAGRLRDPVFVVLAAVALAAVVGFATLLGTRRSPAALPPIQFVLTTTDSAKPEDNFPWPAAISPDGGTVVYTVNQKGVGSFYALRTNELTPRPIPGTEGAYMPYFSPDGQWLGFEMNGKERKVRLDGGAPVLIADAGGANGADWTRGNEIVLGSQGGFGGLSRVSAAGGTAVALTRVDSTKGERNHVWPITTPDGRGVVFAIWSVSLATAQLAFASLPDGAVTRLGIDGIRPLAVLDGLLVYVKADGSVMAVELHGGRTRGATIPVHDPVPVISALNGNFGVFV